MPFQHYIKYSAIIESMKLGINFEAEPDDIFHSHGYAKVAYGSNLGSASSVPGGGRAGSGDIGAVGAYHYADVSHRHKRDPAARKASLSSKGKGTLRDKLQVKEREGDGKGAAFSHRDPSASTIRSFREPPGRPYNPYT